MTTPSSSIPAAVKTAKKGPGFFEARMETLQTIATAHLGPEAMCAYIVLAGGVDSQKNTNDRYSTHSAQSVHLRTMMSRTQAATKAIDDLVKASIIQKVPHQTHAGRNAQFGADLPRWIMDTKPDCNLAVAQSFLQPRNVDLELDKQTTPGSLAHLCHVIGVAENIPKKNALIDAVLMFFALHKHQKFELFGGVDPRAVGASFKPIEDGEDGDETQHVLPIQGVPDWVLVTERKPSKLVISDKFAQATLGCVETWVGAPTLVERARHAIEQLKRAQLVYSAAVVWDLDPVNCPKGLYPEPLYTLYVGGSWASKIEHHLQNHVHKVMLKTQTRTGLQVFADSRGLEANWVRSGIHRFIIPASQVGKFTLVSSLRVRWWPMNAGCTEARMVDQQRVEDWQNQLDAVAARSEAALASLL
jgi:hypothetical protein